MDGGYIGTTPCWVDVATRTQPSEVMVGTHPAIEEVRTFGAHYLL